MSRQYLNVPFARKEEAKQAGARWDKSVRRWYWSTLFGELPQGLQQFASSSPPVPKSVPCEATPRPRREPAPRVDLHFDSIDVAVKSCLERPFKIYENGRNHASNMRHSDSLEWYGVEGGAPQVQACLKNGYPEGAVRIMAFLETINDKLPIATGVARTLVRGDMGDHLDVHSMYRGQLDRAWTSSKRRLKKSTGLIRVCVDICANASTHADALMWRGVAGAAMAKVLEKARYSVEIAACMALREYIGDNQPSLATATFIVKPKAGRVDLDRLACTIGLAGFFRVVGFGAVIHAADDLGLVAAANLGWYSEVSGLLPPDEKVTTLWVPQSVIDAATAAEWVKQTVQLLQAAG